MTEILNRVNTPEDVKELNLSEMEDLAADLRAMIIKTVSTNGGHLAANLGVVELTIAMLKVFSPPEDKIIWDVGHQTYTYKILTGRKDRFNTLRQADGLSGFSRRDESKYDAFGAGHAGTALSAGLGMAYARDRRGGHEDIVVVSGDASAGCGISLEALNNLGETTQKMIVILNDNEMSISQNVGAISGYLGKLLANPRYNRWKKGFERAAKKAHLELLRSFYYRLEEAVKSLFLKSIIFEEFGLRYIGPIDGHNIHSLVDALTVAKDSDRPIIVHVSTTKGKGYSFAEAHPERWHGISGFDVSSGMPLASKERLTYSDVFGETIVKLAGENDSIVAITAAMTAGTGLSAFAEKFGDRFFDVGMSEEHAVVFAAGLATEGLLPVVAIYSTFMQRATDCIIHDVCLQNLPVIMCLDRAGIVGDDGPTHHGVFDIALFRPIPNLVIMQPMDEPELADMIYTASRLARPVLIRYPRGGGSGNTLPSTFREIPLGKAMVLRECDAEVYIWAIGDMIDIAKQAADIISSNGHETSVINARFIKPLDEALLRDHAKTARVIATVENGVLGGGFGAGVEGCLVDSGFTGRVLKFGWPDEFVCHGSVPYLMKKYGITPDKIADRILSLL